MGNHVLNNSQILKLVIDIEKLSALKKVVKTCHDHGALATGGMAASLHQPGQLEQKIHDGKALEMSLGVDGFLIYDLKFLKCLQPLFKKEHQPVQDKYTDSDLLSIPKGKVTLKGLVKNIKVGILFISSWMIGKGGLISKNLSLWLKSQKKCQITPLTIIHLKIRCSEE